MKERLVDRGLFVPSQLPFSFKDSRSKREKLTNTRVMSSGPVGTSKRSKETTEKRLGRGRHGGKWRIGLGKEKSDQKSKEGEEVVECMGVWVCVLSMVKKGSIHQGNQRRRREGCMFFASDGEYARLGHAVWWICRGWAAPYNT